MQKKLSTQCDALLDWYWRFGCERTGQHDLSGSWLDQLYRMRDAAAAVESTTSRRRPCLALWGPSQSGKSTLLSRFLDTPVDPAMCSALQWNPAQPVVFVGRPGTPPGCVQLNPYNLKRDASGCVTRFVLCDEVPDPTHPVEIKLADEEQIMHALAAGYVTECDTRTREGREVFLETDAIEVQLTESAARRPSSRGRRRAHRERLQKVLNVLDDLIAADWPRYRNLRPGWTSLRPRLAANSYLLSGPEPLEEFIAWLFWDGQARLTSLWRDLEGQSERLRKLSGERPLRCTYQVARRFLDMDAYRKLEDGEDSRAVLAIGGTACTGPAGAYCLAEGVGSPVFACVDEFGLCQGLVWEITLPVNARLLPAGPAASLLRAADLLDFPGVAQTYPGGHQKRLEQMAPSELLTEVLKRGKTSSIVISRSRQLGIDGFSLLNRMQTAPAQPSQILTGIRAWVQALGQPWPPPPQMFPVNLVLTFAAGLVNDVAFQIRNQQPPTDLSPVFAFLHRLGELADPKCVRYFTVTYPFFPGGALDAEHLDETAAASSLIRSNPVFQRHFGEWGESFARMVQGGGPGGDGGTDFLIEQLIEQARRSRIPELLERRLEELGGQWAAALAEAAPAEDGAARRRVELQAWKKAIEESIDHRRRGQPEADAAAHVGARLRRLLDVEPDLLEPLPRASRQTDWHGFVEQQFHRWRETRKGSDGEWRDLGLKDAAAVSRHLGYLAEHAVRCGDLPRWLRENLGDLAGPSESAHARRFLATRMAESVCFVGAVRPPHRDFVSSVGTAEPGVAAETIPERLWGYAQREQLDARQRIDRQSPHYRGFVAPFLSNLAAIGDSDATERPPQVGDAELVALAETID